MKYQLEIDFNLPQEFSRIYDAKGVWNESRNYFYETGESPCKWKSENEFKFTGYMRIIGFMMSNSFKKQFFKYMQDFKSFAEAAK